jgi:hypothetical protein
LLRGEGKSAEAIVAIEGCTNEKACRCEGLKDRSEPTTVLARKTK